MTSTATTRTNESSYRRLYIGLWALAGVLLAGLIVLGQPLAGVAAFAGCIIVAFSLFRRYEGPLFDERDESRQAAASKRTLAILGISSAVVFPTVTALWALGVIAWPLWLTPIAFFIAALGFVHVGSMLYERPLSA
jgi:uncharacterized membrane protein